LHADVTTVPHLLSVLLLFRQGVDAMCHADYQRALLGPRRELRVKHRSLHHTILWLLPQAMTAFNVKLSRGHLSAKEFFGAVIDDARLSLLCRL